MSVDRLGRRIGAANAKLIDIQDRTRRVDPDDRAGLARSVGQLHDLLDDLHVSEIEVRAQLTAVLEEEAGREIEQQRYRDLLDLVPVATLMTTPSGLIQVANRAAADLLGVSAEWLKGKPLAAYIVSRRGAVTLSARLRQLKNAAAGPLVYEEQLRAWKGRTFVALVTVSAVRASAGGVAGLQWVIQERDDAGAPSGLDELRPRRVLEAAPEGVPVSHAEARQRLLISAEGTGAYYRSLFDGALDAIVLFDPDRRLFDSNPTAYDLLGYAEHELDQLRLDDLAVGDAEKVDAVMESLRRHGAWRGELHLRRKDGTTVPVRAAISTVASPVGLTYRAALGDLTARHRAQEERVAIIGHELANPLNGILLHAELLKMMGCYREGSVDAILTSIRQLQRLINDLLDQGLTGVNSLRLQPSRVDLAEVLRSCITTCRDGTRTPVIRLDAPVRLPTGSWDQDRIVQVFVNLLSNAVKYSPRDSEIQVRVENLRGRVRVSVVDQGVGIEPDALPHVFDRFFRADSGKAGTHGLGLGLHIAKTLVEAHGGTISVESEVGAGSIFRVTLPYDPWVHEIGV
jgi:PAS domain S-box-containing protein